MLPLDWTPSGYRCVWGRGRGRVLWRWQEQWVPAAARHHCVEEPMHFLALLHSLNSVSLRNGAIQGAVRHGLGDTWGWGDVLGVPLHHPAPGCAWGSMCLWCGDMLEFSHTEQLSVYLRNSMSGRRNAEPFLTCYSWLCSLPLDTPCQAAWVMAGDKIGLYHPHSAPPPPSSTLPACPEAGASRSAFWQHLADPLMLLDIGGFARTEQNSQLPWNLSSWALDGLQWCYFCPRSCLASVQNCTEKKKPWKGRKY